MKKNIAAMLFALPFGISAGQAVIPQVIFNANGTFCTSVSNISLQDINVKIELFKGDGTAYVGPISTIGPVTPSIINDIFSLPASKTSTICVKNASPSDIGYGVIKTSTSEGNDLSTGHVIAHAYYHQTVNVVWVRDININGGMPF